MRAQDVDDLGGIQVDSTDWPILRVTLPTEVTADATLAYLDHASEIRYRKPGAFVLLLDTLTSEKFTTEHRKLLDMDMERSTEETERSPCLGAAIVLKSSVQRGMLSASFLLKRTQWPLRAFTDNVEAVRWSRHQLRDAGAIDEEADSLVSSVDDIEEPPTVEAMAVPIPEADGHHFVEVGRFVSERRAHLRAGTMLDQGLIAVVSEVPSLHRSSFVVRLGPYGSREQAENVRDAIKYVAPDSEIVQD